MGGYARPRVGVATPQRLIRAGAWVGAAIHGHAWRLEHRRHLASAERSLGVVKGHGHEVVHRVGHSGALHSVTGCPACLLSTRARAPTCTRRCHSVRLWNRLAFLPSTPAKASGASTRTVLRALPCHLQSWSNCKRSRTSKRVASLRSTTTDGFCVFEASSSGLPTPSCRQVPQVVPATPGFMLDAWLDVPS